MIESDGRHRRGLRRYRRRGFPCLAIAALGGTLLWVSSASAAPPTIESESVSTSGPTNATLEAEIDPNGASAGAFYQFQLLHDPGEAPTELACPSSPPSGYSVCAGPQEAGALPLLWMTGNEVQKVSIELSGAGVSLSPGRTYYFRVLVADRIFSEDVAEWESPPVVGSSEQFSTPTLPSVESESASNISATDATLEADVNLHEAAAGAYYQFQLAVDPGAYPTDILCPSVLQPGYSACVGPQGSGALPIGFFAGNTLHPSATSHASLDLAGAGLNLQPGTIYHYRILVARRVSTEDTIEWEPPTVFGGDRMFTTLPVATPSIPRPGDRSPPPPSASATSALGHHHHRRHHHHHHHHRRHHRAH